MASKRKTDDVGDLGVVKKFKAIPPEISVHEKWVQYLAKKEILQAKRRVCPAYVALVSQLQNEEKREEQSFEWLFSELYDDIAIYVGTTTLLGLLCIQRLKCKLAKDQTFVEKQIMALLNGGTTQKKKKTWSNAVLRNMMRAEVYDAEKCQLPLTPLELIIFTVTPGSAALIESFLTFQFNLDNLDMRIGFNKETFKGPMFFLLPWYWEHCPNVHPCLTNILLVLLKHDLHAKLDFSQVCFFPQGAFKWSGEIQQPSQEMSASLYDVFEHTFDSGLAKNYSQALLSRHLSYIHQTKTSLETNLSLFLLKTLISLVLDYFCHDSILEKLVF